MPKAERRPAVETATPSKGAARPPIIVTIGDERFTLRIEKEQPHWPIFSIDYDRRIIHVRRLDDVDALAANIVAACELARRRVEQLAEAAKSAESALAHVEQLSDLVLGGLPSRHDVTRLFAATGNGGTASPDDFVATDAQAQAALDAFYGMSRAEQQRVLNGWSPRPDRPTIADMQAPHESECVVRVMELGAYRGGRHLPSVHHRFIADSTLAIVGVTIREGTTKLDALEALREVLDLLRDGWDLLIDDESVPERGYYRIPDMLDAGWRVEDIRAAVHTGRINELLPSNGYAREVADMLRSQKEKGEPPQKPHVPQPTSKRNAKAHEVTAAGK